MKHSGKSSGDSFGPGWFQGELDRLSVFSNEILRSMQTCEPCSPAVSKPSSTKQADDVGVGLLARKDIFGRWIILTMASGWSADTSQRVWIGDEVLAINGTVAKELNEDEFYGMMDGEKGSKVVLTLRRENIAHPFFITLVRGAPKPPKVEAQDTSIMSSASPSEPRVIWRDSEEVQAESPTNKATPVHGSRGTYSEFTKDPQVRAHSRPLEQHSEFVGTSMTSASTYVTSDNIENVAKQLNVSQASHSTSIHNKQFKSGQQESILKNPRPPNNNIVEKNQNSGWSALDMWNSMQGKSTSKQEQTNEFMITADVVMVSKTKAAEVGESGSAVSNCKLSKGPNSWLVPYPDTVDSDRSLPNGGIKPHEVENRIYSSSETSTPSLRSATSTQRSMHDETNAVRKSDGETIHGSLRSGLAGHERPPNEAADEPPVQSTFFGHDASNSGHSNSDVTKGSRANRLNLVRAHDASQQQEKTSDRASGAVSDQGLTDARIEVRNRRLQLDALGRHHSPQPPRPPAVPRLRISAQTLQEDDPSAGDVAYSDVEDLQHIQQDGSAAEPESAQPRPQSLIDIVGSAPILAIESRSKAKPDPLRPGIVPPLNLQAAGPPDGLLPQPLPSTPPLVPTAPSPAAFQPRSPIIKAPQRPRAPSIPPVPPAAVAQGGAGASVGASPARATTVGILDRGSVLPDPMRPAAVPRLNLKITVQD